MGKPQSRRTPEGPGRAPPLSGLAFWKHPPQHPLLAPFCAFAALEIYRWRAALARDRNSVRDLLREAAHRLPRPAELDGGEHDLRPAVLVLDKIARRRRLGD